MTKQYSGLLKITTVLLAVLIIIINLYPLVKGVELFSSEPIVNDILFTGLFTLIGVERCASYVTIWSKMGWSMKKHRMQLK